jgi:hypothetical protein
MTQRKTTAIHSEPFTTNAGRVLCAAVVALVTACGGGGESAPTPAANSNPPVVTTPPTAAAPRNSKTALNLFESAQVLASLSASALYHATIDYRVWTTGPCVFGDGSLQATLDGRVVTAGTLPVGSHAFSVTFTDCLVDGLAGTMLSGTSLAVYTSVDWRDVSALVSVSSMRGTLVAFRSDLRDVTSDGSGTWSHVAAGAESTTTYSPTVGSRLVNNSTGNAATFTGGSYSSGQTSPPPGSSASVWQDFNSLAVAINGTNYILDGTLQSVYGFVGNEGRHTGEVRIANNGTLVARVYGDTNGQFRVEVLSALEPF